MLLHQKIPCNNSLIIKIILIMTSWSGLRISYRVSIETRDLEPFQSIEKYIQYQTLNIEYRRYSKLWFFFVFFCRKSRILRLTHVQKYCRKERLVGIKSYLIFVNCGKPPHHLAMLKYTETCVNLQHISQNRPKLCVLHKIDINFAQN